MSRPTTNSPRATHRESSGPAKTPALPKPTSYAYGEAYQQEQVEKHRARRGNHWQPRIALAHEMIDRFVRPRLAGRPDTDIVALDIGCSIGTMAIEMAQRGFRSSGVDFDAAAIDIARGLAREENVDVEFHLGDVAEWSLKDDRKVDVAICFDIFEHLHDDELGSLLQAIRRHLSPAGALVFYTFPLQYDYLFYSRDVMHWPLVPFKWLKPGAFERVVRAYASMLDAGLLITTGKSYKDRIKAISHCNPTTKRRLADILERAGYTIPYIETRTIYPWREHVVRRFRGQPVAHRNLFGVAYPCPISE